MAVFEVHRRPDPFPCAFRMAQLTEDTFEMIRAEPGVLLKRDGRGYRLFARGGWKPVAVGDWIVRFGHDPYCTDSISPEYHDRHYTSELAAG